MSKKIFMGFVVLVFSGALLSFWSCSKKEGVAGWKAAIETIDGVRTVRNPETPRYGEFAFDLAEDLAIGSETDDDYFFPKGVAINVDEEGKIYASDFGNKRIQVYDKNGVFIRTLGRQGQGPGEYSFPGETFFDEAGNVYVRSSRNLVAFDRAGGFLKDVPIKASLMNLMLGPGGTIVGTTQPDPMAEGGPKNELIQLGPDGERLRTLAEIPCSVAKKGELLTHWYSGRISFCPRSSDSFCFGFSLEYKIHVVDGQGREILNISKTEKAREITSEEKVRTRKEGIWIWLGTADPEKSELAMPDHRPFFWSLSTDDAGRLYVGRLPSILEGDHPVRDIDVFSKDGLYLYRMTFRFAPVVIKGGFVYEVRQDTETGNTRIIRHRINNWSAFKAD